VDDRLSWTTRIVLAMIAVVVVIGLIRDDRSSGPSDTPDVRAYCSYGAVSPAQWGGCMDHVGEDEISATASDAADFAHDPDGVGCGGAGPYCELFMQHRYDPDTGDLAQAVNEAG
jgi:hypothetical protein